jgi:hypothetical protein
MRVSTEIKIASTSEEITQFQKLVFNRYCLDMKWFDPDDYPEQMILDDYDQHSVFIVIYKDGNVIGGTRLVRDSGMGFPHERIIGITLPYINSGPDARVKDKLERIDRGQIMEVTKTISTSVKNMISKDLAKALYWYGSYEGIKVFYMVIDMIFFLQCHKINVPLHPIAISGYIDGSWTIPAVLFTDEIETEIKKNNSLFWDYIKNESNLIGDWGLPINSVTVA